MYSIGVYAYIYMYICFHFHLIFLFKKPLLFPTAESSKTADSTESSTNTEETREKQEEVANDLPSTVPLDGPEEAGTATDDKASLQSDSAGGVVKKPGSDALLDKMESSMEKKPNVFLYEDTTVASFN